MMRWKQIPDIDTGAVYLSRLMLVRMPLFGIYVHVIRQADWAQCQHNHPWSFLTIILRGGYEEQVGDKTFVRRPGYVGYRPRGFEHRITRLLQKNAVTLVFRGPNHESWGFRTKFGHMPWRKYMSWTIGERVAWCDDSPAAPRDEARSAS
jgi:hypothetical protein